MAPLLLAASALLSASLPPVDPISPPLVPQPHSLALLTSCRWSLLLSSMLSFSSGHLSTVGGIQASAFRFISCPDSVYLLPTFDSKSGLECGKQWAEFWALFGVEITKIIGVCLKVAKRKNDIGWGWKGVFCSLLFFIFSWLHHITREILVPGSNSCPLHWKQGVLTTGTPGESLEQVCFNL